MILTIFLKKDDQFCLWKSNGKFAKKNQCNRPTYTTHKMFGEDYAAIHEIKPILMLNKPIYVGFTVLDLNKWKMYDFHYELLNC